MAKGVTLTERGEEVELLARRRTKNMRLTAAALVCFVIAVFGFSIYHIALEQRAQNPTAASPAQ